MEKVIPSMSSVIRRTLPVVFIFGFIFNVFSVECGVAYRDVVKFITISEKSPDSSIIISLFSTGFLMTYILGEFLYTAIYRTMIFESILYLFDKTNFNTSRSDLIKLFRYPGEEDRGGRRIQISTKDAQRLCFVTLHDLPQSSSNERLSDWIHFFFQCATYSIPLAIVFLMTNHEREGLLALVSGIIMFCMGWKNNIDSEYLERIVLKRNQDKTLQAAASIGYLFN
jgi:hypothetical protein